MYASVNRTLAAVSLAALIGISAQNGPAGAQTPAPQPSRSPSAPREPAPPPATPDSVTHHSVAIEGRQYEYTARAGAITLRNRQEEPTARVFYTAYTIDGADLAGRPVTFVYNGGPGSSTMWLRMGSVGPVRVIAADAAPSGPPPYSVVENKYSLLDKSDLVFIDMPASGFGRIFGAGTPKMFFGVDQDGAAFDQFIKRYLTAFKRWNSPKFLFGESYGTTRSAVLAKLLMDDGVALNGIILLSSILNFGLDYGNGDPIAGGDWPYVFYLPTEAATAWYHNKIPNKPATLGAFLASVESFAMGDYLDALAQGDRLSSDRRNAIVHRLSGFLGISEEYIRNANLRVHYGRFEQELLRSDGIIVGRLDGRYQTYSIDRAAQETAWDPTFSSIDAPYTTAINQYVRVDLNYVTPLEYRPDIYGMLQEPGATAAPDQSLWDGSHNKRWPTNVAPDLAEVMTQNPTLRVFSANGYYDFATPYFGTVYTLKHLNLAPALQRNISFGFYLSGHMVYLDEPSLVQFKHDLAGWYDAALAR
jgi:carboxypeptidase C (cathepsin A)